MLRLKRSKTDSNYSGVQIIPVATGKGTCPLATFRYLFQVNPQLLNVPLFCLDSGAFAWRSIVIGLKKRLMQAGIRETGYIFFLLSNLTLCTSIHCSCKLSSFIPSSLPKFLWLPLTLFSPTRNHSCFSFPLYMAIQLLHNPRFVIP